MSKVTELLKQALDKQKKRFFLSLPEKKFIHDAELLLAENLSDPTLIYNVRLKLNSLIEQYNATGKQGRILEDLISMIILCKIEIVKSVFKNIDVIAVEQLLKEKKLIQANRTLHRLYLDEYSKISCDDSANECISKIATQLFADENQLPFDIIEHVLLCLVKDEKDDICASKNLVNAGLVCRYWHRLINTSASLKDKMSDLRLKVDNYARIKASLPASLPSNASEFLNSQAIKIFILPTHNAGATSIVRRYMQEKFIVCTPLQAGVNFRLKNIEVSGNEYKLQIWDTTDPCNFHMSTIYMRDAALALFVFDLTSKPSYNLICKYISDLKSNLTPGKNGIFPIILIGNKLDYIREYRVPPAEISQFVDRMNLLAYFECSAKTREGIDLLFETVERFARVYIHKFDQSAGVSADNPPCSSIVKK